MRFQIAIIFLFSTSLYGQDARQIISHYLDTVSNGTIDNWNKIKSIYKESEVYYSQNDFDQKVNLLQPDKPSFHRSFSVLPDDHKIEMYSDSSLVQLLGTFYYLKDKTIILLGNVPPIIKQPPILDEFYSAHLPVQIAKLMNKSRSIELLGTKEFPLEGRFCYEIKMTTKKRVYVLYINTETFLLEYWNGREDEDQSILTKFSNYRRVGDFLMPMTEGLMKNGVTYFWSNTKKYLINSEIDKEILNYKGN